MNLNECSSPKNLNLIVSVLSGKRSPDLLLNERNLQMGDYTGLGREFKINPYMHFGVCTEGSAQTVKQNQLPDFRILLVFLCVRTLANLR